MLITFIQAIILMIVSWLNKKRKYNILFLIVFFLLVFFPVGLGVNVSYMKDKFITFEEGNKSYVVLIIYKDQFLYTPIDLEAKEIEKNLILLTLKMLKVLVITQLEVLDLEKHQIIKRLTKAPHV